MLKFGIQLPEAERTVYWDEYKNLALLAEELGYDSVWVSDHLLYKQYPPLDSYSVYQSCPAAPWHSWSIIAGLVASTNVINVGSLVSCLAFHPPAVMAKMASTINEMSNGRFIFGVGAGWYEDEFKSFDIPYDNRYSRFKESFEIIFSLLNNNEELNYTGIYNNVDGAKILPEPRFKQSFMVGSLGQKVLELCLPKVERWNIWSDWYQNNPDIFDIHKKRVYSICQSVNINPDKIIKNVCYSVDTFNDKLVCHDIEKLFDYGADEIIFIPNVINHETIKKISKYMKDYKK